MSYCFDESTYIVVENKKIIGEIVNNGSEKTKRYKLRISEEIKKGRKIKIYCKCALGDFKDILEYKISSDLKIYPARHNNLKFHKLYCSKNYDNRENLKYNKGFEENEQGNVMVKLDGFDKKDNKPYNTHEYDFKRQEDGMLSVPGMLKHMMLKVYEGYATQNRNEYSLNDFIKYFYITRNKFFLQGYGKKSLNHLRLNEDGIEFVFGRIVKFEKLSSGNYKLSLEIGNGERSIFISKYEFRYMYDNFKEMYKKEGIPSLSDYPIMAAGFKIKQNNSKYYNTNLHLLLVNKYGLLCDSFEEYKVSNYICDFLVLHKLWGNVSFYKPYKFGFSIYSYTYQYDGVEFVGDYLEDFLIGIRNRPELFVIDIFSDTDEYRNKRNKKDFFIGSLNNYQMIRIYKTDELNILEPYLNKIKNLI